MNETGESFIASARAYFTEDYLPKIERSLELLTDEQIWWRANPQSNSIGNLLLHLSGNVRQWIVCGIGEAADNRDRDSEFAQRETIPREELLGGLKQNLKEVDAVLAKFDPGKLLEKAFDTRMRRDGPGGDLSRRGTLLDACRTSSLPY